MNAKTPGGIRIIRGFFDGSEMVRFAGLATPYKGDHRHIFAIEWARDIEINVYVDFLDSDALRADRILLRPFIEKPASSCNVDWET